MDRLATRPEIAWQRKAGDIPGLSTYNEMDYLDCIYADPNWKKPYGKRSPGSHLSKEIIKLVHDQFDRIVYILSKDMDIQIGVSLAQKMLRSFLGDEAWRYRMITLNNLPWVLGEASVSTSLFGQRVRLGSGLHEAIVTNCPSVLCLETPGGRYVRLLNTPGEYLDINFFFLNHKKSLAAESDSIEESIDFEVESGKRVIYHKTIQIRPEYFLNLIHLPEERAHRNGRLLEMAHELIPPKLLI